MDIKKLRENIKRATAGNLEIVADFPGGQGEVSFVALCPWESDGTYYTAETKENADNEGKPLPNLRSVDPPLLMISVR